MIAVLKLILYIVTLPLVLLITLPIALVSIFSVLWDTAINWFNFFKEGE